MRKKLITIFMSLLCVFFLCGCATVNYNLSVNSDGSVTQTFSVVLNEELLSGKGKTLEEVKSEIRQTVNDVESKFNAEFLANVTNPEIIAYVIQNKTDAKITMGSNYALIKIDFKTAEAYTYYYSHTLDTEDNSIITNEGFYKKSNNTSNTVFNDLENNAVAKRWLAFFGEASGVTLSDCTYSFTYSTPSEHLHSDADYVGYDENGNKAHTWYFTADEITGQNAQTGDTINIYRIAVNSPLWYYLALGLTALLVVVLVVTSKVKENKNKQELNVNGNISTN